MTRKNVFSLSVLIMLAFTIGACSNTRIPSQSNIHVEHLNIQHREKVAGLLFKQRDYYDSLIQWKILRSIQPKNPKYKNRVRVLQALIKRRLKNHLNTAKIALKKNDSKEAELEFLKVLALKPTHSIATQALKKIEINRAEFIQTKKTNRLKKKQAVARKKEDADKETALASAKEAAAKNTMKPDHKENEQAKLYLEIGVNLFNKKDWGGSIREITKYLNSNPADQSAINMITTSHLNLSKKFEARGHLEPAIQHMEDLIDLKSSNKKMYGKKLLHLKKKLSSSYYIEGIKIYRDNINQAIRYWERAINANPNNEKAKIRLRKAKKMRGNLKTIQPK